MRGFMHNFDNGYGYMMSGDYWWMGIIMMVVHLLFWGVVIYLVYRLIKHYVSKPIRQTESKDSAMDILRERYAKGEIDSDEFNVRRNELLARSDAKS
ncbi:SHOCT domain-containing protein [Dehalobacter sp. DCM]|uniref:SHOCT domain-containing protein n=1 Tax=Dehalobacter sp. DCM TaxID=2907827 RepID=UPI0030817BDC|nr:SHOCT domain-containing protein [Dehalobacter sp. DCM]